MSILGAKALLKRDQELSSWWITVIGDVKFDRIILLLKAQAFEGECTPEMSKGITMFIEAMSNIVDSEEPSIQYAKPGLQHNLEVPSRTLEIKPPTVKATKKK